MLSSITSNNKYVITLTPVQKITAKDLHQMLRQVIVNVINAGYLIVSILSDNNGINRKAVCYLQDLNTLNPYLLNPVNHEDKFFILHYICSG